MSKAARTWNLAVAAAHLFEKQRCRRASTLFIRAKISMLGQSGIRHFVRMSLHLFWVETSWAGPGFKT
jgi:hypothetical protein